MISVRLYDDQEVGDLEDILLPDECRFCGIDDKPYVENEGRTFMCESSPGIMYWSAGPFCVCCDACDARGPSRSSPEAAIRAWNGAGKLGSKRRGGGRQAEMPVRQARRGHRVPGEHQEEAR